MKAVARFPWFCFAAFMLFVSCSFDYGDGSLADDNEPDIIMEDVEYTRVRGGELNLRFNAEDARRYEKKQLMELDNFSFEQYVSGGSDNGEEGGTGTMQADVTGSGGSAVIELGSGNVRVSNGVRVRVDSEDIRIETSSLDWKDEERLLEGSRGGQVLIERSDGTMMKGRSFSADTRRKAWEFGDGIEGTYVHEEEAEEADAPSAGEEERQEEEEAIDGEAVD
ncbi:MAG: LPS export ABC transporter periplasmic protein LptC [Spirochaetaceae bacterium]|jgi:LPS export ABC transporter protein LptC|nr:LPS export ABC transporter periplasmic protein LptC [Spirochaetaceae bacterium]